MSSGLLIGLLFPCALFMALRQLPARLLKLQFVAFQSQLFRFKSLDVSLVLTTQAVHEIRQVVELRQVRRREHYVQIGRTAVFVNSDAPLRKDILQSSDALIVLFNAFADLFELALVLFDLQIEQGNLLFGLLDAMIEHRQFAQIPFFPLLSLPQARAYGIECVYSADPVVFSAQRSCRRGLTRSRPERQERAPDKGKARQLFLSANSVSSPARHNS